MENPSEEEAETATSNVVVTEKVGPPKLTLLVAETAPKNVEAKETPVAEEVVDLKEVMKSKPNHAGSATNPGIVVDDELFSNDSFEAKSISTLSYCCAAAAAAATAPIRKLGGVDYLSMYPSDSE